MSLLTEAPIPASVLAAVRAPFEAFGGEWTDAPVLQPLTVLLDLAGEAMRPRLFVVQSEGAEALALRPDFTIPVALAHIAGGAAEGRYLYEGKVFRVAPADSGRAVEYLQIGAERYGPAADAGAEDAEMAALAWAAANAGGRKDLSLDLGDVGLFAAFIQAMGLSDAVRTRLARAFASGRGLSAELERAQEPARTVANGGSRLSHLLTDLPESEAAAVLEELWRLAGIQPVGGRGPAEIVHRLVERAEAGRVAPLSPAEADLIGRYLQVTGSPRAALDGVERLAYEAKADIGMALAAWIERLKALVAAGVPEAAMTLSTGLVRPFGYYDGVLFEVRSAALGPDRLVAAGGRYDGLPARLGGTAGACAIGCIVRPGRAWKEGAI